NSREKPSMSVRFGSLKMNYKIPFVLLGLLNPSFILATPVYPKVAGAPAPGPEAAFPMAKTAVRAATGSSFDPSLEPFYHGVASGDPLSDRVILWTRVTPRHDTTVTVKWRIAKDTGLTQIVDSGAFLTDKDRDYTVKVDAKGLDAGTTY